MGCLQPSLASLHSVWRPDSVDFLSWKPEGCLEGKAQDRVFLGQISSLTEPVSSSFQALGRVGTLTVSDNLLLGLTPSVT